MIVFLLILIVAIMLFGAGAVRGALGTALTIGAVVLVVIFLLGVATHVPTWAWWTIGGVIVGAVLILVAFDARQQAVLRRDLAAIQANHEIEMQRIDDEYEVLLRKNGLSRSNFPAFSSPENPGLNKRKRKALRRSPDADQTSE